VSCGSYLRLLRFGPEHTLHSRKEVPMTGTTLPMPRASGTLTISFGLVNVGVKYAPIIETSSGRLSGKFVDPDTRRPVTQQYVNDAGEPVQKVTGYPHGDEFVVLGEGAGTLKSERDGRLELQALVDPASVDPILFEKNHVVWPDKGHETSYDVLCSVLNETGRYLVGTTVFDSTRTVVLRYAYGCLFAHVCRYDANIRWGSKNAVAISSTERPDPDPALVDMAMQLFETLPREFDFTVVTDDYDARLRAAVEAAAEGKPVPTAPVVEAPLAADLMAALKASVAAAAQPTKKASRKTKAKA
jgi:Ku protein